MKASFTCSSGMNILFELPRVALSQCAMPLLAAILTYVMAKGTLVLFTLAQGCECQMLAIRNVEVQLAAWSSTLKGQVAILRVDFSRRPDLVRQYNVARTPALILLNATGEVIWKQDLGLSDEAPLDLETAKLQIENLIKQP